MNSKTKKHLLIAGGLTVILIGGALLYSKEGEAQPEGVLTVEYEVSGERVLINEGGDVFKPEVKLEKWGDETYIKVWRDEEPNGQARMVDGKTIWTSKDGKREYNLYPLTKEKDGSDGFEYEIILNEKPESNVITTHIESKGLKFYYQPPLDEEYPESTNCSPTECDTDNDGEIDSYRPENVVGSYAVYHESKQGNYEALGGKNYMAGKSFHIYRPKMIDADGWEVWGDLYIENGIQTVTIPQDFWDKAVYPVRHATGAKFGYETDGGSSLDTTTWTDTIYTYPFTAGSAGDTTLLTASFTKLDAVAVSKMCLVIYDATGRVDYTEEISNESAGWHSYSTQGNSITAKEYYLGFHQEDPTQATYYKYDTDAGDNNEYENTGYTYPPPATWSPTTSGQSRKFSIYCTYTPSTGASADTQPTDSFFFLNY